MKRSTAFFLALCLLLCSCQYSVAAGKYTLPEQLKVVPAHADGLSLPESLPPYVPIVNFSMDNGRILLELGETVPKLIILEQSMNDRDEPVESTIFSRKNVSSADTHLVGKEDSKIVVKMIWPFEGTDYVREYTTGFSGLLFSGCSATEEQQTTDYVPYTLSERTLTFNESAKPVSETWKLSNKSRRLIRTVNYDNNGNLKKVSLTWESVKPGEYMLAVELDREGNVTGLSFKDKKTSYFVKSMRIDEDSDAATRLSYESLNYKVFNEKVDKRYPQLALGLIGDLSSETAKPVFETQTGISTEALIRWEGTPSVATMTDLLPITSTDLQPSMLTGLQAATPTDLQPSMPTDLQAATPTDLQAATPTDLQAATPTDLQAATPTDLQAATPTDLQAATPTDLQAATPTDLQEATPTDLLAATPTDLQTMTGKMSEPFTTMDSMLVTPTDLLPVISENYSEEAPEETIPTDLQTMTEMTLEPFTTMNSIPVTPTDLLPVTAEEPSEDSSEEEYTPIPTNARVWSINLGTRKKNEVYVFITTEPILVFKDGKLILDQHVTDVNGEEVKLAKKRHIVTPAVEVVTIGE